MSRMSGKDGFVIMNATRVCNVHFQHCSCTRGQPFATQIESEARWRTEKKDSFEKPNSTI